MDELTEERYPRGVPYVERRRKPGTPPHIRATDTPLAIEQRRRVLNEAMRAGTHNPARETSRETLRSDRTVA